jgi:hypothetical protein
MIPKSTYIDWIFTRSELVLQSETNDQHTEKQNTPHVDGTTKYIVQRRDNKIYRTKTGNKNKEICEKTHLFIITRKKNTLLVFSEIQNDLKSPFSDKLRR